MSFPRQQKNTRDRKAEEMANTLILYDGKMSTTERIADSLSYLIGNAMTAELTEAPESFDAYEKVCFVFNFYGTLTAGKTKVYLTENKERLKKKQVAFVGVGISDTGFGKYILDMQDLIGCGEISSRFISGEAQAIEAGHEIAKVLRDPEKPMDAETLMDSIRAFISSHNTMALATSTEKDVRCTPLGYLYLNDMFYIFSEGGSKFRGLLVNEKVSAAIFDPYAGMDKLGGLQITGRASIIPYMDDEYRKAAEAGGHDPEKLAKFPVRLNLIRITPYVYEFLNSEFAAHGFDAKQVYVTEFKKKSLRV